MMAEAQEKFVFVTIKNLTAVLSHRLMLEKLSKFASMCVRKTDRFKKKKVLLYTHANTHESKTTQGQIPSKCLMN